MLPFSRIPVRAVIAMVLFLAIASDAQISAPTLSSPTNGASGQLTVLTLAWNEVSGASSYTLQLSQTSTFSTTLINQAGIPAISQAISGLVVNNSYFWRVNATGAGGTSAWSSIWSFSTIIVPSAPALSSPANGAINQPTTIALSWAASYGATTYGLQVSTVSTFASLVSNQTGLAVTSVSLASLSNNSTYCWRANATSAAGTSVWSGIWSFTTVQNPPPTPTLVSPSNGAINQPTSLNLSWSLVIGASSYALQVSTASNFSIIFANQSGITATSAAISGLSNNMYYYWRVNATGPNGTSLWSNINSFLTPLIAPAAPFRTSPADNSTISSSQIKFTWQAVYNTTNTYGLQLSFNSSFSSTIAWPSSIVDSFWNSPVLVSNSTYFWRMNATNSVGTGAWSSVWSFTVTQLAPTAAPVLISPANKATISPSATFSWGIVAEATSYRIQIFTHGTAIYTNVNTLITTTHWSDSKSLLEMPGQGPYWRVCAVNASGSGPWSYTWFFSLSGSTLPSDAALSPPLFALHGSSVSFTLPSALPVELTLYSMLGRRTVILARKESPGSYTLSLKNRNLPAGIYFLHFKAGLIEKRMKIVLPGG